MKTFFLFLFIASGAFAQTPAVKWMINPYDDRVFIENNGQFADEENKLKTKILFSFEQGNTTFFLCNNEFIVRELVKETEPAEEEDDPAKSPRMIRHYDYLRFGFDGCNIPLVTGEKKSPAPQKYFLKDALGKSNTVTMSAYGEIVYKDIYAGIDLVFSAHEKNGLKYHFVVHPFAKVNQIKINFSGRKLSCVNGNIHAGNESAEVIDYAPETFYAADNTVIHSSYSISKKSYAFILNDYDKSKTIIIDPWVVNPNFTDQNKAFDITCDSMGFIYVFGGHSPWKLKKFDQNGNLLWTYNTTFFDWYGALAVDLKGNSYITDGCCSGTIQQVDSSGNVGWSNVNGVDEYWRLAFNCDFSELAIGTGYASSGLVSAESISMLDTSTGALSNTINPFGPGTSEPRSLAWGLNGNVFALSCSSDELTQITPAFTPVFTVTSNFSLLYNGPMYANGSNPTSGQNGVSAGNNFIATSNGSTLNKHDLVSGSILSSVSIPGGFTEGNSGILVDNCENIFAGSSNAVIKFDSLLTVVSTFPTTGAVYCLAPGINGDLLVCGDGFIAVMALSVCRNIFCANIVSQPVALFTAPNHICPGTCADFINNSTNATTYLWSFPGANPSTSTDVNPSNICYSNPGSYNVQLIATNANGSDTLTLTNYITVYPYPAPQGILQSGDTLFANAGAVSYQWYYNGTLINGATNYFYLALTSGDYNVVATDVNGCEVEAAIFDVVASVNEIGDREFLIFPNPVRDKVIIHKSQVTREAAVEISIYNVIGEMIMAVHLPIAYRLLPTFSCDVSELPSGLYYLEITTDQNEKIFRAKFVKD